MTSIKITSPLLPNRAMFHEYVDKILDAGWLTNNGRCVQELELKLREYLGVRNLILVSNGTLGLQLAYKALGLKGEIISPPFTFIATVSSAKWEGLDVVFTDIDPVTFNLDVGKLEQQITNKTEAIVAVHVFGNPCDVDAIDALAKKHHLKVIYDAAHAFGIRYKGESILNHGDISMLSFHATKLFHTIEGGALVINNDEVYDKVRQMINFGMVNNDIQTLGINAKMNEFQAAMGLCLLDEVDFAITKRLKLTNIYDSILVDRVEKQQWKKDVANNGAYYPVLFSSEGEMLRVKSGLESEGIDSKRYFFPSLDSLPFLSDGALMPESQSIAKRILCLPLFASLSYESCEGIANTVVKILDDEI